MAFRAFRAFPAFQRGISWWSSKSLMCQAILLIQVYAAGDCFRTQVVGLYPCTGLSMLPTFSDTGDVVLVSRLPYWATKRRRRKGPDRGDLVYASSPRKPGDTVCKRVIGIGGDLIEVEPRPGFGRKGWLRPGTILETDAIERDGRSGSAEIPCRGAGEWVRIPKGHVWLVGDNLSNSNDSRTYGPLPLRMVQGKILARVSADCTP